MSKGIIVLDKVHQTCQHIRGNKESGCPFGGMVCQIRDTDGDGNVSKRTKLNPENCGWNACIDYMIGGDNGR